MSVALEEGSVSITATACVAMLAYLWPRSTRNDTIASLKSYRAIAPSATRACFRLSNPYEHFVADM